MKSTIHHPKTSTKRESQVPHLQGGLIRTVYLPSNILFYNVRQIWFLKLTFQTSSDCLEKAIFLGNLHMPKH